MAVGPLSRYRDLPVLQVQHATRGVTRSLPIRRTLSAPQTAERLHRLTGFDSLDMLALRFLGSEELYWYLLDANGGRLPDQFTPGELIIIPPAGPATQVQRS
jgi:nucleoid-associated protein YgaU